MSQELWVEGLLKYSTMYVASLDVKTAFDVAGSGVVIGWTKVHGHNAAALMKEMRNTRAREVHGHIVAALLIEMSNVRGSACFSNTLRQSSDTRIELYQAGQGSVEMLVLLENCQIHFVELQTQQHGVGGQLLFVE